MNVSNTSMVEDAADTLYKRYKTFDSAILAAQQLRNESGRKDNFAFWELVITKLRTAKQSLEL